MSSSGADSRNDEQRSHMPLSITNWLASAISHAASRAFVRSISDVLGPVSDVVARGAVNLIRAASDALASPLDTITRNPRGFLRGLIDAIGGIVDSVFGNVPHPITKIITRTGTLPVTTTRHGIIPAIVTGTGAVANIVQRSGDVT